MQKKSRKKSNELHTKAAAKEMSAVAMMAAASSEVDF